MNRNTLIALIVSLGVAVMLLLYRLRMVPPPVEEEVEVEPEPEPEPEEVLEPELEVLPAEYNADGGLPGLVRVFDGATEIQLAGDEEYTCQAAGASNDFVDIYPGLQRLYSLQRLNSLWDSEVVRIRRDYDNAEQGFGFVESGGSYVLDTEGMELFVKAGQSEFNTLPGDTNSNLHLYSVRLLRAGYTGPLVQITKADDYLAETQDVYVDPSTGFMNVETIEAFASGDDVVISKYYDQKASGGSDAEAGFVNRTAYVYLNGQVVRDPVKGYPCGYITKTNRGGYDTGISLSSPEVSLLAVYYSEKYTVDSPGIIGHCMGTGPTVGEYNIAGQSDVSIWFESGVNSFIQSVIPVQERLLMRSANMYCDTSGVKKAFYNGRLVQDLTNGETGTPLTSNIFVWGKGINRSLNNSYVFDAMFAETYEFASQTDIQNNINSVYNVSGYNGFVVAQYDQTGSGQTAYQQTAGIQPCLVANGSTVRYNGSPAIRNSTYATVSNSVMIIPTVTIAAGNRYMLHAVTGPSQDWGAVMSEFNYRGTNSFRHDVNNTRAFTSSLNLLSAQRSVQIFNDLTNVTLYVDATQQQTQVFTPLTFNVNRIFVDNPSAANQYADGMYIHEIAVFYQSDVEDFVGELSADAVERYNIS